MTPNEYMFHLLNNSQIEISSDELEPFFLSEVIKEFRIYYHTLAKEINFFGTSLKQIQEYLNPPSTNEESILR